MLRMSRQAGCPTRRAPQEASSVGHKCCASSGTTTPRSSPSSTHASTLARSSLHAFAPSPSLPHPPPIPTQEKGGDRRVSHPTPLRAHTTPVRLSIPAIDHTLRVTAAPVQAKRKIEGRDLSQPMPTSRGLDSLGMPAIIYPGDQARLFSFGLFPTPGYTGYGCLRTTGVCTCCRLRWRSEGSVSSCQHTTRTLSCACAIYRHSACAGRRQDPCGARTVGDVDPRIRCEV